MLLKEPKLFEGREIANLHRLPYSHWTFGKSDSRCSRMFWKSHDQPDDVIENRSRNQICPKSCETTHYLGDMRNLQKFLRRFSLHISL